MASYSLAALDKISRRRLRLFALKLAISTLFAMVLATTSGRSPSGALAFLCGWQALLSAVTALVQRHRIDASCLSGWDEMAAFVGVAALARLCSLVI